MKGPWYTLKDAQQKLELTQTDLLYAIEQQKLTPILFSPTRQFLALSVVSASQRTGCAHFSYQGPLLSTMPGVLQRIAKSQPAPPIAAYQLLDTEGLSAISYSYPFKAALPSQILTSWESGSIDSLKNGDYVIIGRPSEYQSAKAIKQLALSSIASAMTDTASDSAESLKKLSQIPYTYDWSENGQWSIQDLRIPASEIQRYKTPKQLSTKRRYHQLHQLIDRIDKALPGMNNHEIWQIIKHECEADNKIYDTDKILRKVTRDTIIWYSAYDFEQTMKFKTFQNYCSKKKKQINA